MDSHLNKQVDNEAGKHPGQAFDVEDYTFPLTNPRFSVILSKKDVGKAHPLHISPNIQLHLPSLKVPTKVQCYGKMWEMSYSVDIEYKAIKPKGWQKFVTDKELQIGDAIFFELLNANERETLSKAVLIRTNPRT